MSEHKSLPPQSLNSAQIDAIMKASLTFGFDDIGFARASLPEEIGENFQRFIEMGCHGTMAWFERRVEQRSQPSALWPEARGAIVLASSYRPETDPLEGLTNRSFGNVSVYARGRDYHDVIKKQLKAFARWIVTTHGCELKVFVDTAPVAEKPLAALAGLGWQGKHTNLVSRKLGNWTFLSVILLDRVISESEPEIDHCGSCSACLQSCPTDAFVAPYQLDARRCISYLTIEHEGAIPHEFRRAMGNRIYGCDDCLAACPWNKFAKPPSLLTLTNRPDVQGQPLAALLDMDDTQFRAYFSKSPIKRIGLARFKRNLLTAMGNSADRSLLPKLQDGTSSDDPVLREAATFALNSVLADTKA